MDHQVIWDGDANGCGYLCVSPDQPREAPPEPPMRQVTGSIQRQIEYRLSRGPATKLELMAYTNACDRAVRVVIQRLLASGRLTGEHLPSQGRTGQSPKIYTLERSSCV